MRRGGGKEHFQNVALDEIIVHVPIQQTPNLLLTKDQITEEGTQAKMGTEEV